jgi:hypothetical protein
MRNEIPMGLDRIARQRSRTHEVRGMILEPFSIHNPQPRMLYFER